MHTKLYRLKPGLISLLTWCFISFPSWGQSGILEFLRELPGTEITVLPGDAVHDSIYMVMIEQALDHNNPGAKTFRQRIYISHIDRDKPVVFSTEGYDASYYYTTELATRLKCNQIIAEHRYFGISVPDSLDWSYLDTWQAATDHHRIVSLFKDFYKAGWISTGISKGGQTTMYHSFYYPEDVQLRVPYVAPLNHAVEDERIYGFLDQVGSSGERRRVRRFQKMLLKHQADYLPAFIMMSEERNLSYDIVGGAEKAYEYCVLEYDFAYWQWGYSSAPDIPRRKDDPLDVMAHLNRVGGGFDYFSDGDIRRLRPFYYQALTELGYYGYQLERFEPWIRHVDCRDFSFTFEGEARLRYNPEVNKALRDYLKNEASNFIYIYGEYDTWSATRVDETGKTNSSIHIKQGGSHRTRINSFPSEQREEIYERINSLLETDGR